MKHISIIVPEGAFMLSTIAGCYKIFNYINHVVLNEKPDLFKIQLVGLSKTFKIDEGLFSLHAHLIDHIKKTDLIIIPALDGDIKKALALNQDFIPWIVKHYKAGAEVASFCMGAFLLAETGLLKGRKCSTHWMAINDFKSMFPEVELVPDRIITDENRTYSSGGAYSFLNLILHLVEKYAGREIAVVCAKIFEIEIDRESQASYIIFKGQKEHGDELVQRAQKFIEKNFKGILTVDQIADTFSLSRRSLERRFKKATHNTVLEYIQKVKIEAAKKSLESSPTSINNIMYNSGYSEGRTFRAAFKKITGLSPSEYRTKFSK